MAYDVNDLLRLSAVKSLAERVRAGYATNDELSDVTTAVASTLKSGAVDGNTVSLYTSSDSTGTAAFSFDFPGEVYLDQTKSVFVQSFAFSAETYAGATDPSLDGKPVMVLAVKNADDTISYSFADMSALTDTYVAKTDGKDASTTVIVEDHEIDVKVNVSAAEGNQLIINSDGLYVANPGSSDVSNKADKATTLSGYGITDAYTKDEIDGKIGAVYTAAGSVLFSGLPTPDATSLGKVYNISNQFTTTTDFIEGAGHIYTAGTNVVIVEIPATEEDGEPAYMYDILQGFVDMSEYAQASDVTTVAASTTQGALTVDGTDIQLLDIATDDEVNEMMSEVFATA